MEDQLGKRFKALAPDRKTSVLPTGGLGGEGEGTRTCPLAATKQPQGLRGQRREHGQRRRDGCADARWGIGGPFPDRVHV